MKAASYIVQWRERYYLNHPFVLTVLPLWLSNTVYPSPQCYSKKFPKLYHLFLSDKTAWPHNTVHNITLYTGINIIHIYKGILSKDKKTGRDWIYKYKISNFYYKWLLRNWLGHSVLMWLYSNDNGYREMKLTNEVRW